MSFENELQKAFDSLHAVLSQLKNFDKKQYQMSGVLVSAADIVAYQIGWGSLLVSWYQKGLSGEPVVMPGDGFSKWEYKKIALHFYQKYSDLNNQQLLATFNNLFLEVLAIVRQESSSGRLEAVGVWSWCTLKNQKQWPLKKWIIVNTIAPWQRATKLLRT